MPNHQSLGYIYKRMTAQTIFTTNDFPFFAGKKYIPSLSTRSYLHQNSQTYSMLPERIRRLIANFVLVAFIQS